MNDEPMTKDDPTQTLTWTKCFAVPGQDSIIDIVHPVTGRGGYGGNTLEDIRKEYPGAEIVDYEEFKKGIAARQDAEMRNGTWEEVTEERYDEMLNVLPPAAMGHGAFMVGEPMDHHAGTGRPRFSAFKREGGKFFTYSASITHKVFCEMFGKTSYDYVS